MTREQYQLNLLRRIVITLLVCAGIAFLLMFCVGCVNLGPQRVAERPANVIDFTTPNEFIPHA